MNKERLAAYVWIWLLWYMIGVLLGLLFWASTFMFVTDQYWLVAMCATFLWPIQVVIVLAAGAITSIHAPMYLVMARQEREGAEALKRLLKR